MRGLAAASATQAPARERATTLTRVLTLPAAEPVAELWAALHLRQLCGTKLARLARRAQRFTPRVSLEPPDGLLLEVRGSLHLFGGMTGLRAALLEMCGEFGLAALLASAPTPLAALVLARAGKATHVMERAELVGKLAELALGALRWPPEVLERLKSSGVRTIGAALRLPRAGFARRFGTAQLASLDRLTGRTRELRTAFRPREAFRRRHELSCEVESHAYLLAALMRLLEELEDFLKVRQCGVMTVECRLLHRQAGMTPCVLRLAAPGADARHLGGLFAEEFQRLALPQAVRALELRAGTLLPLTPAAPMLWQPGEHGGGAGSEAHALIERLQARLGEAVVHGLALLDDHRPESCWAMTAPPPPAARAVCTVRAVRAVRGSAPPLSLRRPLWLLPVPQPLAMRAGLPWRRGLLQLLSEPERIETGWWDGEDVARDYYTASDIHGVRLWIFRERTAAHGWFLHGIFG
ncbi:MAG TPA: DNA polymerase Y family protein [Steroidobacteraceae bacterium]|nr:DNA polymerase Y family protein [Steroidobacteraceae bacterium]